MSSAVVTPLTPPEGSKIDFGAAISGIDVENLSDADFDVIRNALFTHQVLVFKNQSHVSPKAQFQLTNRFDPSATSYGHGKTLDNKSILHPDIKTVPSQPQVQILGNGFVPSYQGLENFTLRHPHHRTFHATSIPPHLDLSHTRFYRWHIDAALYDLAPPVVTTLLAVQVPRGRTQTCIYTDLPSPDSPSLTVPLGTTAFVSSYTSYSLLSPRDQLFARTTRVEYAPHPYIWMSPARSRPDGLGLLSEDKELPLSSLPEIDESKIQILPMVWKNPLDGRLALQVHPSAVRKLHLADGTVVDDLKEVRGIVHRLQRPGIDPERVYAHDWEEGDLVLFHNRGVLHSVVGAFAEDEVRLFRQCNVAASSMPEGPEAAVAA
ncbi:hypothetical protein QBC34DRAFT_403558 [Podospora aff. communis PSN243]|uniref:TauD/TfdA-like domain-containing protein n=1 Tax=Podospora aff. communis PSN243 TaxID=3040156 RepID=A0AAV9GP70_9PEZI|nr:hypothetical protein QBC34DRAFT_403558 [Podospora aff. communis PSN243]